jgi:hypothetical protein
VTPIGDGRSRYLYAQVEARIATPKFVEAIFG